MNIAFTSILIFIILSPGFMFKIGYNSTNYSVKDPNRNIVNELTKAIIPSIIFHILFLSFLNLFTKYEVNFEQLGYLILGTSDKEIIRNSFAQIGFYIYPIFFYNLFIISFSYFLGHLVRVFLVRKLKLDTNYPFFRFTNKWFYIFEGEFLNFPNIPNDSENIALIMIDVLTKVNGESIIYIGELSDYVVDSAGKLELIKLRYPIRRPFKNDEKDDSKFYEIDSRYLVITASEILNINIRYFNLTEEIDENLQENFVTQNETIN
jgi:hypothetical protein